jgi:hypothetical protein
LNECAVEGDLCLDAVCVDRFATGTLPEGCACPPLYEVREGCTGKRAAGQGCAATTNCLQGLVCLAGMCRAAPDATEGCVLGEACHLALSRARTCTCRVSCMPLWSW